MRLLEKGLHGGLGIGNLGVCVAGHGVGKTSFLVGVAMDELLRGGTVLHIALGQTVTHVRDHYDTVYAALARGTHLDDALLTRAEVDQNRRIHAFRPEAFTASKLAHAAKLEAEVGGNPTLILIDGPLEGDSAREELISIRQIAQELAVEVWFTFDVEGEEVSGLPPQYAEVEDLISVILALAPRGDEVILRALKDHDSVDLHNLHVGLDPKTLLLTRS